jgi:hypothetical protein
MRGRPKPHLSKGLTRSMCKCLATTLHWGHVHSPPGKEPRGLQQQVHSRHDQAFLPGQITSSVCGIIGKDGS